MNNIHNPTSWVSESSFEVGQSLKMREKKINTININNHTYLPPINIKQ